MGRRHCVEWLERRLYLTAVTDPTPDEQEALELINRMRQNPAAELPLLENTTDPGVKGALAFFNVNLTTLAQQWASLVPAPPLAWNSILAGTALGHDQLMLADNSQSHQLPGEEDLGTRVLNAGYDYADLGESIYIAATSVFDAHTAFAIDWGDNPPSGIQDPPGHRENIMNNGFTEMGIAFISGPGDGDGTEPGPLVVTEDFGSQQTNDGPFLLGSAFSDTDGTGFYAAGEGLAGVNVQAVGTGGTFNTTTLSAGGYQMQLPAGSYTVTFSGGPLATPKTYNSVVIGSSNVEVDMDTSAASITSGKTAMFIAGTLGSFIVTTSGAPEPAISDGGFNLPAGLSFTDNGDGTATLEGTPAANSGGTYIFTVSADNGLGAASAQKFTLTIDQDPAISSGNAATFNVGANGSFAVLDSGFPAVTLSETGALPSGVVLAKTATGGSLHGIPAAGKAGIYPITFTAANGVGTATQVFTLTVGQLPAFSSLNHATVKAGTFATFNFVTTGFPTPTVTETGALPSGMNLLSGSAAMAGTIGPTAGGAYAITLVAKNSGGSATQVFTLTVDQAPSITSGNAATFTVGTASTFAINTIGFPAVTVMPIGALPAGVAVRSVGGQAVISGTPIAGTGKIYAITLNATNGISPAFALPFTLTVDQPPAITMIGSPVFSTVKTVTFPIHVTGFPLPAITPTGLPSGLSASSSALTGEAAASVTGPQTVTLTAANAAGTVSQVFTLTVDHPPAISIVNNATFTVGTAGTLSINTSGFPAPTVMNIGALPAGLAVRNSGGHALISGTPAAGTGKTYTVTLVATNAIGTAATQTFTLTVDQPPAITVAARAALSHLRPGTISFTVSGFPAPTVTDTGLPSGLTLNPNHTITGTAAAGIYAVTLTAINGIGLQAVKPFTLTVS